MDTRVVPVLLAVSLTPGLCMMLALTLGAAIGLRRTLWMMIGELSGLALVSILSITGVAALMLTNPDLYRIGKVLGGCYLLYVGVQMARTDARSLSPVADVDHSRAGAGGLILQGFLGAVGNPKAWLFYASLLPPFIRSDAPLLAQVISLVSLLLVIEFMSLLLYAGCGRAARGLLKSEILARGFFIIAGAVVFGFGVEIILVP
jgi:homoserine/homoserine lactone efflux protein